MIIYVLSQPDCSQGHKCLLSCQWRPYPCEIPAVGCCYLFHFSSHCFDTHKKTAAKAKKKAVSTVNTVFIFTYSDDYKVLDYKYRQKCIHTKVLLECIVLWFLCPSCPTESFDQSRMFYSVDIFPTQKLAVRFSIHMWLTTRGLHNTRLVNCHLNNDFSSFRSFYMRLLRLYTVRILSNLRRSI